MILLPSPKTHGQGIMNAWGIGKRSGLLHAFICRLSKALTPLKALDNSSRHPVWENDNKTESYRTTHVVHYSGKMVRSVAIAASTANSISLFLILLLATAQNIVSRSLGGMLVHCGFTSLEGIAVATPFPPLNCLRKPEMIRDVARIAFLFLHISTLYDTMNDCNTRISVSFVLFDGTIAIDIIASLLYTFRRAAALKRRIPAQGAPSVPSLSSFYLHKQWLYLYPHRYRSY